MKKENLYTSPIGLTSQYRFCGNSFRVDTYRGCAFRCSYCFVTSMADNNQRKKGIEDGQVKVADMSIFERLFKRANSDQETLNQEVQLIRQRVPFHVGGMSDPFQFAEWKFKATKRLIELTNQYNYPAMFSTKTDSMPDEYIDLLNPEIHAFQFSFSCCSQELSNKYEKNSGSVSKRIELIHKLKKLGFWVSIRLQPVIDTDESIAVLEALQGDYDFVSIEHLKLPSDNKEYREYLIDLFKIDFSLYKRNGREYELESSLKLKSSERIKKHSASPVGFADNDLLTYSDTNNCCGIDTINSNFNNWLKANAMTACKNNKEIDPSHVTINGNMKQLRFMRGKNQDDSHIKSVIDYIPIFESRQYKKGLFD